MIHMRIMCKWVLEGECGRWPGRGRPRASRRTKKFATKTSQGGGGGDTGACGGQSHPNKSRALCSRHRWVELKELPATAAELLERAISRASYELLPLNCGRTAALLPCRYIGHIPYIYDTR